MAQEQVNVQLNLISNAEQAVQALQSQLDQLKSKSVEIPVTFNATSTGTTKVQKDLKAGLQAATDTESVLKAQARTLDAQIQQYRTVLTGARNITSEGKGGARVLQAQVDKIKGVKAALKSTQTEYNNVNKQIAAASAKTTAFSNALKLVKQEAAQTNQKGFFDGLLGKLTLGGIAVEAFKQALSGVGDFINQGIQFEQLTLSLEAFTGSTKAADDAYTSFKDTALKTPFSIAGVAQAGKTLLAFKVPLDQAKISTQQLSIIAGATGSDLNNLARNLGQISAQGRAYTRDLNQFATAGIPIYEQLALVLGVTIQDVRQFAEDGKIGFNEVQAAITSMTAAGSSFANLADRQLDTVAGQIGNVQTAVQELAGAFIKTFGPVITAALRTLKDGIDLVTTNFDLLASVIITLSGAALGKQLIPALQKATGFFTLLKNAATAAQDLPALRQLAQDSVLLRDSTRQATDAAIKNKEALIAQAGAAKAALIANAQLAAIAVGIGLLVKAGVDLFNAFNKVPEAIDATKKALNSTITDLQKVRAALANTGNSTFELTDELRTIKDIQAFDKLSEDTKGLRFGLVATLPVIGGLAAGFFSLFGIIQNAEVDKQFQEIKNETILWNTALSELIKTNAAYIQSDQITQQSTLSRLGTTRSLIKAGQDAAAQTELEIAVRKQELAQLEANGEGQTNYANKLRENLGLQNNRLIAQRRLVQGAQAEVTALEKLLTAESQLQQFYSNPTLERRAEVVKAYKDQLDATIKSVTSLISAQKTLAEAPVKNLELQLRGLSVEYDKQLGLLKQQKTEQDNILNVINSQIALQAKQAFGKSGSKEILALERDILATKIQQDASSLSSLNTGTAAFKAGKLSLLQDQQRLAGLDAELGYFDQKYDAETELLKIGRDTAKAELNKFNATKETTQALIEQRAITESTLVYLDSQSQALAIVAAQAAVTGAAMDTNINGSLQEGIGKASELAGILAGISNVNITVTTSDGRASGGPVSAGAKYTVNELGKEAFLSASGRLSMINAPAWGTWRAPESGTVIPAHLTRQLSIPAGGINLNSARGVSANRRVAGVSRGSDARTAALLHSMNNTQQAQAQQLGKLSRAIDTIAGKEWKVDLNINGNNPLLNKLRRH